MEQVREFKCVYNHFYCHWFEGNVNEIEKVSDLSLPSYIDLEKNCLFPSYVINIKSNIGQ